MCGWKRLPCFFWAEQDSIPGQVEHDSTHCWADQVSKLAWVEEASMLAWAEQNPVLGRLLYWSKTSLFVG